MGTPNYDKRRIFWLRFSGWLCLLPASVYLEIFQSASPPYSYAFLIELIIIIIFAGYLLATATHERWRQPKNIMKLMIFAIIFVSLVVFIPLCFAYVNCRKQNR